MIEPSKPNPLRYVVKKRRQYIWRPKGGTKRMRALGFRPVNLGTELTPAAIAKTAEINAEWDRLRREFPSGAHGEAPAPAGPTYPRGTVGYAMEQVMELRAAKREQAGKTWDRDQEKRDDWARALKRFKAVGLDCCRPAEVPTSFFLGRKNGKVVGFIADLERDVSPTERHRVIKTWRALWNLMTSNLDILGTGKLLTAPDPTAPLDNPPPAARDKSWSYAEVVKLVEHAWATERKGLATLMAIAWDTMLSPIDVRKLTRAKMQEDTKFGAFFLIERTKTGRPGFGTLTDWSCAILRAYLDTLGVQPLKDMPLFYTPGSAPGPNGGRRYRPQPYSKKLVEEHFRDVRSEVFGKDETRTLADFRRSGSVEGDAGGASVEDQSNKMANRVDVNAELRKRYNPRNLVAAKRFDAARVKGREALAKPQQTENVADEKVSPGRPEKVSPLRAVGAKSLI
jgi:hypothetical protein